MNVILVCGPPGSGKTSYVMGNKRWADLIVDRDLMWQAVSGEFIYDHPEALRETVEAVRDAIIKQIDSPNDDITSAWIIMGGARATDRQCWRADFNATVYIKETSPIECMKRIAADKRRADRQELWQPIVTRWWRDYERDERDIIIP